MTVGLTVALWSARKMVSLHHPSKALAFGEATYVYQVTLLQKTDIDSVSALDRIALHEVGSGSEFTEMSNFIQALKVALLWRIEFGPLCLRDEAYLDSSVTIVGLSLYLCYH